MTQQALPTADPAAQGVDASGVHAFLDALEADPDIEPHGLTIVRHGHVVASGTWAPYAAERPHLLYSLSKSFASTAAGLAEAEGLIDFDATVLSYFPEIDADITDPRSRSMLVRHVASMASGHDHETVDEAFGADPAEPVRGFLLQPPQRDPGTLFTYNQPCTYTLGAIVQRVTGQTLVEYLRPRLFDPLGIGEALWSRDRAGRDIGFAGLHVTHDAIARFGLLYLNDGVWQGERLLPEGWVERATRPQIDTAEVMGGDQSDWGRGYGYQFWIGRHGYRGDGAYGQFCVVLPEHDAVIAATSATAEMQRYLELVWRHLLPAFGPAPLAGRDAEDTALRERLERLALPATGGAPAPAEGSGDWSGAAFTPEGGLCAAQPKLTAAELTADDDGGWTLTLDEGGHRLAARWTGADWTVTEGAVPVAVTGGWDGPDALTADIAFLETPHRLRVTCSLTDRTFRAHWLTTPLVPWPLRALRAPRG
ncbi:serine hydrolase domain-containing protein [Streptomyces pseudogriseolus]|uniref:serine hydrolase domain-containing protein n=1 Tax=Streptomyces pseudogriseolus TaxID=36817 RepID=UPI001CE2CF11|nr:serine hydrolase [Streptomyces pseudogriseolus]